MKTPENFSRRENEVIDLVMLGKSNKQIAFSLGVSERTIEFHLKNIYVKMKVNSRVELILILGKTQHLVESTVEFAKEELHNGNQHAQSRAIFVWRNLVSLIKREVAMAVKISFEDIENYLQKHLDIFCLLVFLVGGLTIRYVLFDIGLYFGGTYILLELSLLFAVTQLGEMLNGTKRFCPLMAILVAGILPLLAAGFDQLYLHTMLRFTDSIHASLPYLCLTAEWLKASDGTFYLSTQSSVTSDFVWFFAMAEMLFAFLLSRIFGKHSGKENLVTA